MNDLGLASAFLRIGQVSHENVFSSVFGELVVIIFSLFVFVFYLNDLTRRFIATMYLFNKRGWGRRYTTIILQIVQNVKVGFI